MSYEEKALPFDLWRLIKSNPLIPMLAIGALLAFGFPKLLVSAMMISRTVWRVTDVQCSKKKQASLDPEILNEVQANQAQLHNAFSVSNYIPIAALRDC